MPRSLNSRCHRTSSLETFLLPSAQWWSSVANANSFPLKKPSETSAPETPQHLLTASKTPFTCHQGERWSRKSNFQETVWASKPEDKKEKWGWPDSWHWSFGYFPIVGQHWCWWQWSDIPHLLFLFWTKSVSCGMLLGETRSVFLHRWVTQPQQRRNLKRRMKQSHFEHMRLRRSAYTFIAINIVCFDLIQLSCLPTGKGLKFSDHKNKTTERREPKEKSTNDHCIFTGSQSSAWGLVCLYVRWRIQIAG